LSTLHQLERKSSVKKEEVRSNDSENKKSYLERKELDKRIRKLEKEIHTIEKDIESLEAEKDTMEEILSKPEENSEAGKAEFFSKYEDIKNQVVDKLFKWEEKSEKLERLKSK